MSQQPRTAHKIVTRRNRNPPPVNVYGKLTHAEMNGVLAKIEDSLGVGYDVLEDALCNWQKSPSVFMPFRG